MRYLQAHDEVTRWLGVQPEVARVAIKRVVQKDNCGKGLVLSIDRFAYR